MGKEKGERTVVAAEDEPVQPVQAEEVEEVPGERGDPADVHVGSLDAALQHALEPESEGERQFNCGGCTAA